MLSVRLFGTPEIRVCGAPLPALHSRRGVWLLALLALRAGVQVERSRLAGLLWPDSPEATALHNLRQTLGDLRRALGPAAAAIMSPSPRTLQLDPALADVDLAAFDAAVRGPAEALEAAAALYRGPLLEGCDEPWALEARASRERAHLGALERLAERAAAAGDHAGAARWLRLAVEADPYCEPAHRGLMRSLAASGELTAATEVYRELRGRLHRELNAAPDPQTTAAYRAIRDAGVPSPRPCGTTPPLVARPLPAPRTELIGRADAVRDVTELLGRERLVTLLGTGGIGKTRLALQVATELQHSAPDGAAFAPLAALADPTMAPDAVRESVGAASPEGRSEPIAWLCEQMASRRMLLVLDNCEHLIEAAAALADALLARCPHIRILATSRRPLCVQGEVTWQVPPLVVPPRDEGPEPAGCGPAGPCASVELFARRAQAVCPALRRTPATERTMASICRQLDGIPLAIELAAARASALPLEVIGRRLAEGIGVLQRSGPVAEARHHTLDAAFRWSWDLLTAPERTLLNRLSVFAGGCTLEAVEAVCAGGEIGRDGVVDLLASLVDKSLVVFQPGEAHSDDAPRPRREPRYHLLEPVRLFAAERLDESGERDEAQCRHRDHFLEWAEQVRPRLWQPNQGPWFDRLEADHDNLRAALAWCRSRPHHAEHELRLVVALARFWDTHGHVAEGRAHLEAALERTTPAMPHGLRSAALVHAGWIAALQGDSAAARRFYEQALPIFDEHGDRRTRANVLGYIALVAKSDGAFAEARALLDESLAIRRELGLTNLASILGNLGELELRLGNFDAARERLEESARQCMGPTASMHQLGRTLSILSKVDAVQDRLADAEAHCAEGLRRLHQCEALVDIPDALEQAAALAGVRGQWERAARILGAADRIRRSASLPPPKTPCEVRAAAQEACGADGFARKCAEGERMDVDAAVACALGEPDPPAGAGRRGIPAPRA